MKTTIISVLAVATMATLVGCGKKDSKSSHCNTYSNGVYVSCSNSSLGLTGGTTTDAGAIATAMNNLRSQFNSKSNSTGVVAGQQAIFFERSVSSSSLKIFGINLGSYSSYGSNCDFFYVDGVNGSDVIMETKMNGSCTSVPSLTIGTYDRSSNTALTTALASTPAQIVSHTVTINNISGLQGTHQAYSLIVQTPFTNYYKEYVIAPDLPVYLNPVAIYDSQTGAANVLNGAYFQ